MPFTPIALVEPRARRARTSAAPPQLEEEDDHEYEAGIERGGGGGRHRGVRRSSAAAAKGHPHAPVVDGARLVRGARVRTGGCGSGSTIGPDGALYVTDGKAGRVLRVDPRSRRGHDVRDRAAAVDPARHRGRDRHRLRRPYRLRAGHTRGPASEPGSVVAGSTASDATAPRSPIADIGSVVDRPSTGDRLLRRERASSTRLSRTRAASRSPTGTTIASCASAATAASSEIVAFGNVVPTGLAAAGPRALHRPGRPGPPSAR